MDQRGIYLLSAALIVVDFNFLRKHGTEADAIWLATGIFVSIVNIFISLLNIFSAVDGHPARPRPARRRTTSTPAARRSSAASRSCCSATTPARS